MKQGRSITDWAVEIERQANTKRDYMVDTAAMELDNNALRINTDGQQVQRFDVLPSAHRQIASRLNIPQKYYDKMQDEAPHLLQTNVNHWFTNNPETRMIRTLDGKARAFLSNSYQRIDNYDVVNAVMPILQDIKGLDIKSCQVTDSKMYLKVVSTETRLEVNSRRVGDFVESGVIITNSEIGLGSLSIMPFFHFLVCTNGMVRNKDGMRAYHVGAKQRLGDDVWQVLSEGTKRLEDAATLSRVRDVLGAAMDKVRFQEAVDLMQQTTENKITGNPTKVIETTAKLLTLNETETSAVFRHLIDGGDLSQYGLMNAVTRTAEDIESYDRATELETMGGKILDLAPSEWKVIASAA